MKLRLVQPTTRAEWNGVLRKLPAPHLLQTWEWSVFKSRYGWQPTRYAWIVQATDEPQAAASVLTRSLGPLPTGVMYVPKGPVLDYGNPLLVDHVLSKLEEAAAQTHAVFVKIDPDVRPDTDAGNSVIGTLRRRGWQQSEEEIQFRNTVLLDLTPSLEDLLMGMKSKWRYNIRLAERSGVTVRHAEYEDLSLLYDIYHKTAARGDFVIRAESYYHDAWGSFIEAGLAQPFIAEVEDVPVAMVVIYRFGKRAYYMYGGSRSLHREKMPNNLLQWESIKWAKEQGCTVYDMWGAPDELDQSDPMWGVYRFKKGFGGEFVEHIGAWDYPASRPLYSLYTAVKPRFLAVMRWLHWQGDTETA